VNPPITVSATVQRLLDMGVRVPSPLTVVVGDDVKVDQIAADVTIYPGCRIAGQRTVLSPGVKLGQEAPVVIEDCQLGRDVELKGGYFRQSTFLDKANMGLGAQVREACLLEEEANGAHTVGLKQTILFPFVTLGSLINFCDVLMSGGTSRKEHSEVGSSYIHFNFTPEGDKATPSLIGDVPRGVLLNRPPIFLGGQGGIVGPIHLGFGTIVAAGSILRHDIPQDGRLIVECVGRSLNRPYHRRAYPNLVRIVNNNVRYLGNLLALDQWYRHVRRGFFGDDRPGRLLYEGARDKLALAKQERIKRLRDLAAKMPESLAVHQPLDESEAAAKRAFHERIDALVAVFTSGDEESLADQARLRLTQAVERQHACSGAGYIAVIQALSPDDGAAATAWLQAVVDHTLQQAWSIVPQFQARV
jgi:UDP-N-acetylglucosamine/UDP-N-acetylgalactosamine diphosphorylase